jgi:hypothetical protein
MYDEKDVLDSSNASRTISFPVVPHAPTRQAAETNVWYQKARKSERILDILARAI